jgi:hypothetical protein
LLPERFFMQVCDVSPSIKREINNMASLYFWSCGNICCWLAKHLNAVSAELHIFIQGFTVQLHRAQEWNWTGLALLVLFFSLKKGNMARPWDHSPVCFPPFLLLKQVTDVDETWYERLTVSLEATATSYFLETSCRVHMVVYPHFRGTYCLHLQGWTVSWAKLPASQVAFPRTSLFSVQVIRALFTEHEKIPARTHEVLFSHRMACRS